MAGARNPDGDKTDPLSTSTAASKKSLPNGWGPTGPDALRNLVERHWEATGYRVPSSELRLVRRQTTDEGQTHELYSALGAKLEDARGECPEGRPVNEVEWIMPAEFRQDQWGPEATTHVREAIQELANAQEGKILECWAAVDSEMATAWAHHLQASQTSSSAAEATRWDAGDGAGEIGAIRRDPSLVAPVTADEFAAIFRFDADDSQISRALPEARRKEMLAVLWEYRTLFLQPTRLGAADLPPHEIEVTTARPLSQQPYRVSPVKQEAIAKEVAKLKALDCVEDSTSPWASPVVLVSKPDGSWRFCVDFRNLNAHTVRDVYPLPRIQDTLHLLGGNSYFTTLDLLSGFWQISLTGEARQKTAFITPQGLYQFKVMPMGLANAPATFQRSMDVVLAGLKHVCCMVYVDDILIYSKTWEQHLKDLRAVFERLSKVVLFVKPNKCSFGATHLQYLGHEISAEGLKPAAKHVEAVRSFPVPRTKTAIKSFLGLASFNRLFIENFASISAPLRHLLRQEVPPDLMQNVTVDERGTIRERSLWDSDCDAAFRRLKHALSTAPLLGFPDWTKSFTLRTDASIEGLGAVLRQGDKVIAYLSRSLTPAETRLDVRELECLAVHYACESLRPYLQNNRPFLIQSDHKNLTWLRNVKHDSGRLARWALRLSEFPYFLEHIPGTANVEADALSRHPVTFAEETAVMSVLAAGENVQPMVWTPHTVEPQPSRAELIAAQKTDVYCMALRSRLRGNESSPVRQDGERFCIENDLLLNLHAVGFETRRRVVVPTSFRRSVMWNAHNSSFGGHAGRDRTIARLQLDYYWPGMVMDVRAWCKTCQDCQKVRATRPRNRGLMQLPAPAVKPFQTVGIDLLGPLPLSLKGNRYCLTVLCHFSHWPILIPVPNKEARTLAEALFMNVICEHGAFERLLSDRESTLAAPVVAALVRLMRTKRVYTSAYQPSTNGMVERCHKWINATLRAYANLSPTSRDWETSLKIAEWAYRTSTLTGTEFTPFYILYGRHPVFPQDVLSQGGPKVGVATHDYVMELQQKLATVHDRLARITTKLRSRMKAYHDRGRVDMEYDVGDLVLVFYPPLENSKVFLSWRGPFEIVQKVTPLTYRLKNLTTNEVHKELTNINRLAKFHKAEHEALVTRGEGTPAEGAADAERAPAPGTTEAVGTAGTTTNPQNKENKTENKTDGENETENASCRQTQPIETMDVSDESDVITDQRAEEPTPNEPTLEVKFTTQPEKGPRKTRLRCHLQTAEDQLRKEMDEQIDGAIEVALKSPMLAADPSPAEAFSREDVPGIVGENPRLSVGDMVIVRLDPSLYDAFIPPAERARKERRGRTAKAAQSRGAEKEEQSLVWRVAEILQVIPPTPTDEMAIYVHLYDTNHHHRDVTERVYAPAYRDTLADRDVYDRAFRGELTRPQHFIEYKDSFPISALLTRAFALRKNGTLPNHVVEQLLPHLFVHVSLVR